MEDDHRARLRMLLESLPPGPVNAVSRPEVVELLSRAWSDLGADDIESTRSWKLGQCEYLVWDPPSLRFDLEPHGGTIMDSSRAELHHWQVNIEVGEADVVSASACQLRPGHVGSIDNPAAEAVSRRY